MRLKELDVGFGGGIGRGLDHRQGIDDWWMRAGREGSYDVYASVGYRVGLINDAEGRLVALASGEVKPSDKPARAVGKKPAAKKERQAIKNAERRDGNVFGNICDGQAETCFEVAT